MLEGEKVSIYGHQIIIHKCTAHLLLIFINVVYSSEWEITYEKYHRQSSRYTFMHVFLQEKLSEDFAAFFILRWLW